MRISLLPSAPLAAAFLLIDPISDVERTILKLDPLRFAAREECYCLLIHERHVPQIEAQRPSRCLGDEQLL